MASRSNSSLSLANKHSVRGATTALLVVVATFGTHFAGPAAVQAGAWTTEEGVIWGKIALFHLNSERLFVDSIREGTFCEGRTVTAGERAPYDCQLEGGGGLITTQLFLEAAVGIHERVDLRLQVPVILQGRFDSMFVDENEQGLGDVRVGGQVLLLSEPFVWSGGWEIKIPTGEFLTDAVRIPLGEGQWDFTFRTLLARSFIEGRLWVGGEFGYRVRLTNEQANLSVGDELVAVLETGGQPIPWVYLQVRSDFLWGFPSQRIGGPVVQELAPRRVLFLQPSVTLLPFAAGTGPLTGSGVEVGVRIPVWGRGWPADPVWFVALSTTVRVFDRYSSPDA